MSVGSNGLLANQPIVVGMATDPKPHEAIRSFGRECAVVTSYPCGPEAANLLELKRGIPRILLETLVCLIGEFLHLRRQ